MIKSTILDELDREKDLLEKLESKENKLGDYILTMAGGRFYYREKGSKKRTYIKRSRRTFLRAIAAAHFLKKKISILKKNILALETFLPRFSDYDDSSVADALPKTYRAAIDYLKRTAPPSEVIQSEDKKRREDLIITASNGLKVRSKGELAIAEMLTSYNIDFRYEKALELIATEPDDTGITTTKKVTVHPDFTIPLPDGTDFYWEHAGMYDKAYYREMHETKMGLYYDNGIYEPYNLVVTMDGPGKPLNNIAIRRIIETQILPLL